MPDTATLLAFLAAALAMQATPGPDMALVVSRGVGQGRRVALCTAVGMTALAGTVQLPLLAFGVASAIGGSPVAFEILRWAGAAYLVWLGVRLLRRAGRGPRPGAAAGRAVSAAAALREGMVANLTHPKPLVFMVAFLPQFVDPARGPVEGQLLLLGATQKLSGLAVLGLVAWGSGSVGGALARRPGLLAWQERLAGAVMVLLGARLLLGGGGPAPAARG